VDDVPDGGAAVHERSAVVERRRTSLCNAMI
jgi:hypothetical protein